jgi:hypothetical protein
MELPKFVSIDERGVWQSELDAMYDRHNNLIEDNNAFLFWQFNCKVRSALLRLRERIEGGEFIKITAALVADEAQVQPSGFYHKKRRKWFDEEIKKLKRKAREITRKSELETRSKEKEVKELKQRYQNLLQRFADLNQEFSIMKLELHNAERTIKSKDKEINRLKAIIEDKLIN